MTPDQVYGSYLMAGYSHDDLVGLDFGKLANLAFNPLAQTRAALGVGRAAAGAVGRAVGIGAPRAPLPPPPALAPSMVQAGHTAGTANTIHAYMGLGAQSWSVAEEGELDFVGEPQSSFIGRRLVIAARYSSGATGRQVTISSPLTVSGMPQTPAPAQRAPIEMFSADTTYSALDLQIATSATQITISLSIDDAPGSGEKVNVSCGLYGEWIR
jgi:hypothetical protein